MLVVRQFRKKPVVIEAAQYNGTNAMDIVTWVRSSLGEPLAACIDDEGTVKIRTLESGKEGYHVVSIHDYVIKGVAGEFYPCKPEIFSQTYEEVAGVSA